MINKDIENKKEEIQEVKNRIEILENNDNVIEYNEALDSMGDIKIGNLTYSASYTLKRNDRIAYDCGFNDFNDEELSNKEEELEELEEELKELIKNEEVLN